MKLLVKTFHGLEDILYSELEELGASNLRKVKRGVACEGNLELLYTANYKLRTALRVLVQIHTFEARNERELYDQVKAFDWSDVMDVHQTFAIANSVFSDLFKHSKFATLRMKDAIADQFREKYGERPSVDSEAPDVQFDLHSWKENCTISLDSSGEALNQRGYRGTEHEAPLNEVLAAGMIQLAGWDKTKPLIDPMCGTGTLLIEAAMLGHNMPPQKFRQHFNFKTWRDFNPMIWNRVKLEADSKMRKSPLQISGGDSDKNAVDMAKKSLKRMGLHQEIFVRQVPFENHLPKTREGMIITNPPYGERIGKDDIFAFYKTISDLFKNNFPGFEAWVISSNREAFKELRLKATKRLTLFNGGLECSFQQYKMYEGSETEA